MSSDTPSRIEQAMAARKARMLATEPTIVRKFIEEKIIVSYAACLAELNKHGIDGVGRSNPLVEVHHVFAGFDILEWAGYAFDLGDRTALRRMLVFEDQGSLPVMRMKNWEAKIDFNAIGWQGLKPSEVFESIIEAIGQFKQQNPAVFEEAQRDLNRIQQTKEKS